MKTIHEILTDPDTLLSLPDDQFRSLLAPYIPAARQQALPAEKPSKLGLEIRTLQAALKDPSIMKGLEALTKRAK